MEAFKNNIKQKRISIFYFLLSFVVLISEIAGIRPMVYLFKPLLIPTLILLYFFSSAKKNMIYLFALLFVFISNISFLETTPERLFYGVIMYMGYRFLTIVLVYRIIKDNNILPLTIATIPFLCVTIYLIILTEETLAVSFYPALINAILISLLGGLSLSNYILNDNKKNSLLLISTLLFVVQNILFIIQKYYFTNEIFQPISIIILATSHYAFYKFLILDEESKPESV
jgi:hypothetical protein